MKVDDTIPLWSLVLAVIIWLASLAWTFIKMYFQGISFTNEFTNMKLTISKLETEVKINKEKHEEALHNHEVSIAEKLDKMNRVLTETHTWVKILMSDRNKG